MADKRAYFKLDVGYLTNPKVAAVAVESPTAVLLHVGSIAYAAQHLTDGVVPVALIRRLTGATAEDAAMLINAGLWIDRGDGQAEVHDYLEHQRSASEVKGAADKAKRAAAARWTADPDASSNASSMPDAMPDASETAMPREIGERERSKAPRTRGTRLPDVFVVTDEMRTWAKDKGYGHVDLDAATEEFCDYWRAVAGAKGVKTDWLATWRNDIRRKAERTTIRPAGPQPTSAWDRQYARGPQ